MTDNEKRAKIGEVLDHYVRWYNHCIEIGYPSRGAFDEMNFRMWLDYNHKDAVEMFGFDLLFKNLNLCVSSCGPSDEDIAAWID